LERTANMPLLELYTDATLLIVRLVLGAVMVYYGLPKIKDLAKNAKDFKKMGFGHGMFWGTIVAVLEFFGGIAIVVGIYPLVVAFLFGFQMIVGTVWKITKVKKPFPDWSYDIILLALTLVLLAFGTGSYILF